MSKPIWNGCAGPDHLYGLIQDIERWHGITLPHDAFFRFGPEPGERYCVLRDTVHRHFRYWVPVYGLNSLVLRPIKEPRTLPEILKVLSDLDNLGWTGGQMADGDVEATTNSGKLIGYGPPIFFNRIPEMSIFEFIAKA